MARTVLQARARDVAAMCAIVMLAVAAPATARDGPPGSEDSAVSQYAEVVPGAGGPTAPGVGRKQRATLPTGAVDALSQAPLATAAPLEEIATSSTYGAPATPEPARERKSVPPDASLDATVRSTAAAIGSTSDARLIGMLAALLLTTLVAVALALGRARRAPS